MERQLTEKRAYGMYIASLLIVGTIGVFRRAIPLSSGLLAFVRGLLGALSLVVFVKLRGRRIGHGLERKKLLLLVLTGVALSFNWMLLFEAYTYTTVASATLCYYFQPTIVLLLSPLLFGEKLTGKKLLCAALAVLGKQYGYNMRTLRSRPVKELLWEYYFYLEAEGEIFSEKGQNLLRDMAPYCDRLKVVGTFSRHAVI